MASVEAKNGKKERFRQTWLYVSSSGIGHVQGMNSTPHNGASSLDDTVTMKAASVCDRLSLPLESDNGEFDSHIQQGFFPTLFQTNQILRNQQRIIFTDQMDMEENQQKTGEELSHEPTVLYVAQGEIAHCTFEQADILVSDRATTCHVLALYSYRSGDLLLPNDGIPLCTMMHLDACTYDSCVRNAIEIHSTHHCRSLSPKLSCSTKPTVINLDIHLVGGFKDDDGSSFMITNWIMNLLADIAGEFHETIPELKFTLRTACITAANHEPLHGGPMVRGLGLLCRTGRIMVVHCVHPGPALVLRMARLWVRGHGPDRCGTSTSESKLALIHASESECIEVEPLFPFGCHCSCGFIQNDVRQEFEYLWHLRDDKMFLNYCSTSPAHEEKDFCESTRASFQYIVQYLKQANLVTNITPEAPHQYRRAHRSSNAWKRVLAEPYREVE